MTNSEGGFRLENPTDRSTRFDDSLVNERHGHGHGHGIRLTEEQLAQIEEAKRKAGVK